MNMLHDSWWISTIDHRVSTALVFFLLLMTMGNGHKKPYFPLRILVSFIALCAVSWLTRYWVDLCLTTTVAQGIGYSLHLLVMSLLYWGTYTFCYHTTLSESCYMGLLALTIFKLAWNTFKVFAAAFGMTGIASVWSRYSVSGALVSYLVYIAVCAAASLLYKRLIRSNPPLNEASRIVRASVAVFLLFQIVLEYCGHVFTSAPDSSFMFYLCALLYTATNYIILITIADLARYRQDNEEMQKFIANKMQYYQMSRDGITSLQIKCHDLKHQIATIRSKAGKESFDKYIDRLEDSIIEYGTVVECGNETINIVLTEKNILCSTCGVKFSYLIDGSIFGFMSEMELFSLFGNALDNALEGCNKVTDHEKRVISLKANAMNGMVVLHVENSYEAPLNMVDDMPVTTKAGTGHGFGLRSIQAIAEKYDGIATVVAENGIFKLTVVLHPPAGCGASRVSTQNQ